jgi:hypothetical protein
VSCANRRTAQYEGEFASLVSSRLVEVRDSAASQILQVENAQGPFSNAAVFRKAQPSWASFRDPRSPWSDPPPKRGRKLFGSLSFRAHFRQSNHNRWPEHDEGHCSSVLENNHQV